MNSRTIPRVKDNLDEMALMWAGVLENKYPAPLPVVSYASSGSSPEEEAPIGTVDFDNWAKAYFRHSGLDPESRKLNSQPACLDPGLRRGDREGDFGFHRKIDKTLSIFIH